MFFVEQLSHVETVCLLARVRFKECDEENANRTSRTYSVMYDTQ